MTFRRPHGIAVASILGACALAAIGACGAGDDSGTPRDGGRDGTANDGASESSAPDAESDHAAPDASSADGAADDASADTGTADAHADADTGAGHPLGTPDNPAASCKALLATVPGTPSGTYSIAPSLLPADAFDAYCDMTTEGGGWTKVTNTLADSVVRQLLGASGRQMIKCTDPGTEYVASPSFTVAAPHAGVDAGADAGVAWSWNAGRFVQVGGTWRVNGADQACGTNPEYTTVVCPSWWGVGCGNGGGPQNKFFPGVLDVPSQGFCADTKSGHTNAAFTICTTASVPDDYRMYTVLVRAD
jgi:hypothetical protein